jgi:hypothetical protein
MQRLFSIATSVSRLETRNNGHNDRNDHNDESNGENSYENNCESNCESNCDNDRIVEPDPHCTGFEHHKKSSGRPGN